MLDDDPKSKTLIFSATQKSNQEETTLFKSLKNLDLDLDCDVAFAVSNKSPLPLVYNLAIEKAIEGGYESLILVHDDVILEEDPIPKLEKLYQEYDLIGVAGASKVEIKSPALWHLMGGGNLHGCVQHTYRGDVGGIQKYPSNFGLYPNRAVMIDGVFMAMNRKCFETQIFDESNPSGFHFYDLDISLSTHLNGMKVGVGNILITHESPGLREFTPEWLEGEKWFLKNYGH
jgi:hypothetical protein